VSLDPGTLLRDQAWWQACLLRAGLGRRLDGVSKARGTLLPVRFHVDLANRLRVGFRGAGKSLATAGKPVIFDKKFLTRSKIPVIIFFSAVP